jgi:hypothetical protein
MRQEQSKPSRFNVTLVRISMKQISRVIPVNGKDRILKELQSETQKRKEVLMPRVWKKKSLLKCLLLIDI